MKVDDGTKRRSLESVWTENRKKNGPNNQTVRTAI